MEDDGDNPFADPRTLGPRSGGYGTNGSIATNPNAGNSTLFQAYDPFGDVGAQPVANQTPATQTDPLEGYNPFEKNASTSMATASTAPAVLDTNPPPYSPVAAQQIDTNHYVQQQRELDRKARELEDRERELKAKDERLRQQEQQQSEAGSDGSARRNNWPPLPSWIPIKPCFYQDVEVEIPSAFQHIVKQMYYLWLFHVVLWFLNFIGGLAFFFKDAADGFTVFLLSLVWLVVFTPCSYVCWFRPVYKAFRSDSSINFMIFFFVFCAQAGVVIFFALGIWGSAGLITGVKYMKTDLAVGIICLVIGILGGLLAVADILMVMRIHKLYRSNDAVSMAQARQEGVSGLMSNKGVRDTVVDVGAAAATAAASRK